jgi:(4-alkanoyl-5-oxo-2,5-dihydrofuran-3-yl)methyl phosphate reductase
MILVTGATGTVGRELVAELARRGAKVRAMSRNPAAAAFPDGVETVPADLGDSGLSWTILRPGAFMSNTLSWAAMIRHRGQIFAPFPDVRTAATDPADVAACAATVLLDDGHEGRAYPLTGPELLSARDQAAILGEVLGRDLGITGISARAARQAMIQAGTPAEIADAVLATAAAAGTGPGADIQPAVRRLTGRPPQPFRAWAVRHAAAFR